MNFCLTILRYIKRNKNVKNWSFWTNWCSHFHALTHLYQQAVLTKWWNYYSLIFSEADRVAISETQIVFCVCFVYFLCNIVRICVCFVYFLCNIVRSKGETEKEKLYYRNIDLYNYFGIKIDILVKIDIAYLKKRFQLHQSLHRSCQP